MAGARCVLQTNCATLVRTLSQWAAEVERAPDHDFLLRVSVDGAIADTLEPAHFRGSGHLVIAEYGENVFMFDLHRKAVHAWISNAVASDTDLWNRRLVPLMLGVLGCAVRILPLHSACVVRDGHGILIAGESMAGKSTLSVAMAREGFALLSDDWTYIRAQQEALLACGLHTPVKLLPDAVLHFPELNSLIPVRTTNGEIAFEVSANEVFRVPMAARCRPRAIVFLERLREGPSQIISASREYVQQYVANSVDRMPRELQEAAASRQRLINLLTELPSWTYRYAGSPQMGAGYLARFIEQQEEVIRQ